MQHAVDDVGFWLEAQNFCLFGFEFASNMPLRLNEVLMTSLWAVVVVAWLVPLPEGVSHERKVVMDAGTWQEAEEVLHSDLPVGTVVRWVDEDEAGAVWLRAADLMLEMSPAAYRCWVGLDLNCNKIAPPRTSLRGLVAAAK